MQVSVETTGALERRMEISVPAQRIEQAINERLQSLSRTVRLKGFRPGKVPVKVVRQQFGQQVRQEVLDSVVQSTFAEALTQEKLNPAAVPRFEPISDELGQDLKYRAIFEVLPSIEVKGIEDIQVNKPVAEVSEADIDAMIENLRTQRPEYNVVEREAGDKDRVTVDFEGTVDAQPFEGGAAKDMQIVLGAGRMLPDLEAGLKGVRAGDSKTIDVRFPDDYPAENLKGKTAQFAMKVSKVEEQKLPELDDEFCKIFGVQEGGIARLREEVADNMRRELSETIRARTKQQAFDGLLAANTFELPKTMVDSQVQELQVDAGRRMGAREASQLPPAEQFQEAARRRVALGLLVGEIIKSAKLEADRIRVQQKLTDLIQQYPDPTQVLKAYRENPQLSRQIESMVLEDQVVEWLLERAKVTEQPSTFKELMNFGA
jgi:trigger factor